MLPFMICAWVERIVHTLNIFQLSDQTNEEDDRRHFILWAMAQFYRKCKIFFV